MFNNFNRKKIKKQDNSNLENDIIIEKREQKKQSLFFRFIKLLIWIFLIFIVIFYKWYNDFKTDILIKDETKINIEKNENIEKISEKLNINETYLKIYLKYNNPEYSFIEWSFLIKKDSWIEDILEYLQKPISLTEIEVTILEWWNIFDIDEYLVNRWLIKKWEYIDYVRNKQKIEELTKLDFPFIEWLETLEWYLYPDTYKVLENNFKINNFVIAQLNNFEKKVIKKLNKELNNKELEKLINLSSIVEKEEKNTNEKETVAWILKKRLDNNWMIWADITVCYPHKLTANECKMIISKYINQKSDYNTRTMTGLPKTPIWNPSFETINATLNYKETPYWFYLHDTKTWKIYYASTNTEHEKNKRLYLR